MSVAHWQLDQVATETVPCPLCGGRAFTPLCATDRYDMNVATVGCNGCGLVFTNPQPTDAALDDFYTNHYRRYYQKTATPSLEYIREYRKDERAAYTADFLVRSGALPAGARVLDIGAAEGAILKGLRDRVADIDATAVEPNPEFGGFAKGYAGCTVVHDLKDLPGDARFDLVILNHVFEHLKDPPRYLAGLAQKLTPRGRVYIDVPDLLQYKSLDSMHIAHLYHFTVRTLGATAAAAGCRADVLETHEPINHPKSIRTLLAADAAAGKPALAPSREGWDLMRRIDRKAWRYHRKRWSKGRRLRALFASLTR